MKLFLREKTHSSQGWLSRGVGCTEVGYEGFYCNNNSGYTYYTQKWARWAELELVKFPIT